MKRIFLVSIFFLSSCTSLPELYQTAEDIANDDAIDIMISREAINKKKDVNVNIEIKNAP